MEVAGVSPDRIALVGQSLGTAVTFAVAERLATSPQKVELGAVISIAGFSDMRTLLHTYAIGGVIPILSPLKPYPKIQNYAADFCTHTWRSDERLARLVKASSKLKLFIIHAKNDFEIPHEHAQRLFFTAANATLAPSERESFAKDWWTVEKIAEKRDLGAEGSMKRWPAERSGGNLIEQWIVTWGGKSLQNLYVKEHMLIRHPRAQPCRCLCASIFTGSKVFGVVGGFLGYISP